MAVDLPAPLGPRKPCTSPRRTSRSSPSRARVRPKLLTSPLTEMTFSIILKLHLLHKVVKFQSCQERVKIDHVRQDGAREGRDMAGDRDETALRQYVEDMARLYADWGFPRMAARVLMQLMVSDTGALTAKELSDGLEISPAAVSQSVRYLQHLGLVERSAVPGSR